MTTAIRIMLTILYISAGLAVAAVEARSKPALLEGNSVLWSIAFWPAFPITRAYRALVGDAE